MKSFLGNFYWHLAIFFWSHWSRASYFVAWKQFRRWRKNWQNGPTVSKVFPIIFFATKGTLHRIAISRILHFANAIRHCIALRWHSLLRFLLLFNYASGDNYYWKHFLIYLLLNKTFAKKWMDSNTFYWCWKTVWWRHPIGHLITAIRVEVGLKTLATAVPTTI